MPKRAPTLDDAMVAAAHEVIEICDWPPESEEVAAYVFCTHLQRMGIPAMKAWVDDEGFMRTFIAVPRGMG